jgi:hypothetical protein
VADLDGAALAAAGAVADAVDEDGAVVVGAVDEVAMPSPSPPAADDADACGAAMIGRERKRKRKIRKRGQNNARKRTRRFAASRQQTCPQVRASIGAGVA